MGGNRKILLLDRVIGRIAGLGEKSASKVSHRVMVDNRYILPDKYKRPNTTRLDTYSTISQTSNRYFLCYEMLENFVVRDHQHGCPL